ncbi:hypothetical protein CWO92_23020 [Heyndrickxia camelliae]|uniref:Uncharacterized protein n=1 Tax=Heyndrickxia camelliae TaxID=1707093 RepID=A0A2N3LDN4_9BACI|nr:hypothetical protein CWO92_23020 [Heyndrickxia camelliae]
MKGKKGGNLIGEDRQLRSKLLDIQRFHHLAMILYHFHGFSIRAKNKKGLILQSRPKNWMSHEGLEPSTL